MLRLEKNGGYWRAVGTTYTGAPVSRGLGNRAKVTRAEAIIALRKLDRELTIAGTAAKDPPRLKAWCDDYTAGRAKLADGSRAMLETTAAHLVRHFGADTRMDRITRDMAAKFREDLEGRQLSESTVRGHLRRARQLFAAAVSRDRLTLNPFDREKCSEPKTPGGPKFRYMTIPELEQVLEASPSAAWRCLWALCRLAGCRRDEALSMTWEAVDFQAKLIHPDGKTGARITPMVPRLAAIMLEAQGLAPARSKGPCEGITTHNIHKQALAIIQRAGLPVYAKPFHALRKALVSDWQGQHPPLDVAKWLGHSVQVAADHYHSTRPDALAKVTGEGEAEKLRRENAELQQRLEALSKKMNSF